MKTLPLALGASLLALTLGACNNQQPANQQNDGPAAAPVAAPNGDWSQLVTQTSEGGMLMGNPQARVKVVEFSSMTCPACAAFATEHEPKLVNEFVKTGNVSFELRNFVRDPLDITLALVARCGGANPQFFALTKAMFENQKGFFDRLQAVPQDQMAALQNLPPAQQFQRMAELAGVQEFAAQRGLPSGRSGQCLANQAEIDRLVQMNSDASTGFEIAGTPTFLVNNEVVRPQSGQDNWTALQAAINAAL